MSFKRGPLPSTPATLAAAGLAFLWLLVQQWRMDLGIAWEDSYHHWLIAAQFARTGNALDPLTATSNGWLPVYHWLAGSWLAVVGWHNLDALTGLSLLFTLTTATLIGRSRGLLWGALFLFNPVTVLNGGLTVTEPLAVLFAVGAVLLWEDRSPLGDWGGATGWALAALTDRGCWPVVAAAFLLGLLRGQRSVGLVLVALATGYGLTRSELTRTATWAAVDQRGLPTVMERLTALVEFSWRPLAPPLLLGAVGLFSRWQSSAYRDLALLTAVHLGAVFWLVGSGGLTGSSRYYLLDAALLALLAGGLGRFLTLLVGLPAVGCLAFFSAYYLQLWPKWVILNRPSVQAGQWIANHPTATVLATDSPVIAYYSYLPPEQLRGTARLTGVRFVAAILDRRYEQVYPLLLRYPQLLSGQAPPGWQPVYESRDWTLQYGAKPVRIYALPDVYQKQN